jgi:hypothetical protein
MNDKCRPRRFRMSVTIKRDEKPLTPRSYSSLEITDEDAAIVLKRCEDRGPAVPVPNARARSRAAAAGRGTVPCQQPCQQIGRTAEGK